MKKKNSLQRNEQVIDFDEARAERRRKRQETLQKRIKPEKAQRAPVRKRTSAKAARRRAVFILFLIVLLSIASVSAWHIYTLKQQALEAERLQQTLLDEKARLELELSRTENKDYIEQQARDQLKMVMPGEILYVMPEEGQPQDESQGTTGSGILP